MIETFTGQNHFALQRALRERVESFIAEHGELAFEQLDGQETTLDRIQEAISSLPFLAVRKLVVIQSPSSNKQFQAWILEDTPQIPEVVTVIFVEPNPDKRSKYYKWLKAQTRCTEFAPLDERGLATWASTYAREHGARLEARDANYLIQRIGLDQIRLASEIDKLTLGQTTIDRNHIDALTEPTPQSKIFDLLEAAFSGNAQQVMDLYADQRAQKVEPQEIIAMLGWQLRQIALAKAAGSKHDLVREAKLSPYGAKKAVRIAHSLSLTDLKQFIANLTELDVKSKRQTIHLDQALRTYLLQLHVR